MIKSLAYTYLIRPILE